MFDRLLSEEWVEVPLGSLAQLRRGITYSTDLLGSDKNGLPYINMKSFLKGGGFNLKGVKEYSGNYQDEDLVLENDLLIANTDVTSGDIIGSPVLLPDEFKENKVLYSHHVTRLRLNEKTTANFLSHLLRLPLYRKYMLQNARGTTVLMLDMAAVKKIPIKYPADIRVQKKICRILDTLDTQIRQTEAIIAKLQQVKQGLLHDLLTRGIDESGQLRPPYEQAPELYKKSPLGWIPKEWEILRLATLSESGLSNGVFKEPKRVGNGVPLVNVADLYRGDRLALEACELFDASPGEVKRYGARKGDIFFTRSSLKLEGIAQTSYLNSETKSAVYECHVMRLRPKKNLVFPRYLKEWCVGSFARKHFMEHAKQVTMTTISQDGIAGLLCPKPDLDEQEKCVAMIESHESRILKELNLVKKLKKQKAGLMDDLLTGRVRVTELIEQEKQAS